MQGLLQVHGSSAVAWQNKSMGQSLISCPAVAGETPDGLIKLLPLLGVFCVMHAVIAIGWSEPDIHVLQALTGLCVQGVSEPQVQPVS